MHEQPKNRDWVKNAAIIFLAVLLVLTFFSNTIMNRSLPEVATQDVTDGSIVARVRGTGKVTANSNAQVKMEKTRVIRSVLVKVGQQVQAGDVLFTLGEGSSEDIDAAEEKLRTLQTSYNKIAATMPDYSYGADYNRLQHLADALHEAEIAYDAALKAAQQAAPNTVQLENAKKELAQAEEKLKTERLEYDTQLEQVNKSEDIQKLENEQRKLIEDVVKNNALDGDLVQGNYNDRDKLVTQLMRIDAWIKELETKAAAEEAAAAAAAAAETAAQEAAAAAAEAAAAQAQAEAEAAAAQQKADEAAAAKAQQEKELADAQKAAADAQKAAADAQKEAAEAQKAAAEASMNDNGSEGNDAPLGMSTNSYEDEEDTVETSEEENEAVSDQAAMMTASLPIVDEVIETEDTPVADNGTENTEPKSPLTGEGDLPYIPYSTYADWKGNPMNLERLKNWKAYLQYVLDQFDDYQRDIYVLQDYLSPSRTEYDAAVLEVEKWRTAVEVLSASGNTPQTEAYKTAKSNRDYAEEQYLSAKQTLNDKINNNQNTITGYNIDLADIWQQIEKAKQKLADLTGDEEAQILARVSGTIQSISAAPGDTKKKDDVLAVIEAPDMGYNLSFSVTNDQAARLRVGDTATVSNFYWGAEITATLASIQIDQKNPQTNKLLTFDLSGNVTAGTDLTLSVGQKSANYDIIIPSSAIRTDTNGTFVLKVESKNSPLGNRYIARRVPVEVLASDDTNSAVSADLGYGDYVITTSSAPLKNGQLVRLAST